MKDFWKHIPQDAQVELHRIENRTTRVSFANSELENITNSSRTTATVRVIKDGRISSANGTKPDSEQELLERALATARFGSEVDYSFPAKQQLDEIALSDDRVEQIDVARMLEMAEDLVSALIQYNPRIRAMARVGTNTVKVDLSNSNGFEGSYHKTIWTYGLGGRLVSGQDMLWIGEFRSSCCLETDFAELKRKVIERFETAQETIDIPAGTYPVIFAPGEVTHILRPFLECLNGRAITNDISPWKEKLGQKLLDERVTLVDDGSLAMTPSSAPFDREGVPTRRNVLIDKGMLNNMMLDLQSAHELGKESTGNGTTSGPRPHHVILQPGQSALDDIIKSIGTGIIIYGTMGAWTGNPYSGNVSGTISLGLKIENGQIAGRVKDCMFSINSFNYFRDHLVDISRETKNLGGATLPYVLLDDVVISTKK